MLCCFPWHRLTISPSPNSTPTDWLSITLLFYEASAYIQSSIDQLFWIEFALIQFWQHVKREFNVYSWMSNLKKQKWGKSKFPSSDDKGILAACASMVKVATELHLELETGTAVNVAIVQLFQPPGTLRLVFPYFTCLFVNNSTFLMCVAVSSF